MTLEAQVCSLAVAEKLRKLGVEQRSLWYWCKLTKDGAELRWNEDNALLTGGYYSAFTVAELGELLPARISSDEGVVYSFECWKDDTSWHVAYWWQEDSRHLSEMKICLFDAPTESDARAKMLVHLIENELVPPSP